MLSEIVYTIEEPRYVIEQYYSTTYFIEVWFFLLKDTYTGRNAIYIVDYITMEYPIDARRIIQTGEELSFEKAKEIYPDYILDENNYGF